MKHLLILTLALTAFIAAVPGVVSADREDDRRDQRHDERHYRDVEIKGYITRMRGQSYLFDMKAENGDRWTVKADRSTKVLRLLLSGNFDDLDEGDKVVVYGRTRDRDNIDADKIRIVSLSLSRDNGKRWGRVSVDGRVVKATSVFDRTIKVDTRSGKQEVYVEKDADVEIDNRSASVHDIDEGDQVKAYGRWDHDRFVATRLEVKQRDGHGEPDYDERRTGEIVWIDRSGYELKIRVDGKEILVKGRNAEVRRNGSTRRFSDLNKYDRIRVIGEKDALVIKAVRIEIIS